MPVLVVVVLAGVVAVLVVGWVVVFVVCALGGVLATETVSGRASAPAEDRGHRRSESYKYRAAGEKAAG